MILFGTASFRGPVPPIFCRHNQLKYVVTKKLQFYFIFFHSTFIYLFFSKPRIWLLKRVLCPFGACLSIFPLQENYFQNKEFYVAFFFEFRLKSIWIEKMKIINQRARSATVILEHVNRNMNVRNYRLEIYSKPCEGQPFFQAAVR